MVRLFSVFLSLLTAVLFLTGCSDSKTSGGDASQNVSVSEAGSVYESISQSAPDSISDSVPESSAESVIESAAESVPAQSAEQRYYFRSQKLLAQHYEKHGREMGFSSAEEYEKAASSVITNPAALHKTEKEDSDDVYYVEKTNEFVVLSTDGFIRTYFLPDRGIDYFNKQ